MLTLHATCTSPHNAPYLPPPPMRFASRGRSSRIPHRNALTEKAWEDAVQGLSKILATDAKVIMTNQTLRYSGNHDIFRSSWTKGQGWG